MELIIVTSSSKILWRLQQVPNTTLCNRRDPLTILDVDPSDKQIDNFFSHILVTFDYFVFFSFL